MSEPIQHVSDTAYLVATHRAIESERPDALFRDPLAERLSGAHGRAIVKRMGAAGAMIGWSAVVRTVVIDQYIRTAIAEGGDTILNLGAGLDTRPYRLALPEAVRWIEVDYPHVIEHKNAVLRDERPTCRLERRAVDLADAAARRALFAEVDANARKVLVLTEGVIPYLRDEDVASLADDLRACETFRYWVADYFAPEAYKYRERSSMRKRMQHAPFRFQPADYFGFFTQHGWRARDTRYMGLEGRTLGRPMPLPRVFRWWLALMGSRVTPEQRERALKFTGYVLFEPAAG